MQMATGWGFTHSSLLLKYTAVSNKGSSWLLFMSLTAWKALGHPLWADTGYLQITVMETRPTFCLLQQLLTTVRTTHLRKSFCLILEKPSKWEARRLPLKHHLFLSPPGSQFIESSVLKACAIFLYWVYCRLKLCTSKVRWDVGECSFSPPYCRTGEVKNLNTREPASHRRK